MTTADFSPDADGRRRWFFAVGAFFGPVLFILVPIALFLSYSFFSVEQRDHCLHPELAQLHPLLHGSDFRADLLANVPPLSRRSYALCAARAFRWRTF